MLHTPVSPHSPDAEMYLHTYSGRGGGGDKTATEYRAARCRAPAPALCKSEVYGSGRGYHGAKKLSNRLLMIQPPLSAERAERRPLRRNPTAARARDMRPINRAQRLAPIGRPAPWPSGRTRACNLCSPCQCQYRRPCLQRQIAPQVCLSTGSGALQHELARVRAQRPGWNTG